MILKKVRNKINFQSLKSQLILSYIVISAFVLALSTFLSYYIHLGIVKDLSQKSTVESFQQVETNINSFMEEIDNFSKVFISNQCVQDLLDRNFIFETDKINIFKDFTKTTARMTIAYSYIESVFIFSKESDVFGTGSLNNWYISNNMSNQEYDLSKAYALIEKPFPRMTLVGGLTSDDFMDMEQAYSNTKYNNYITAVRGINSLNQSIQSATLLININERKLNSIYSNLSGSGIAYLMDGEGNIISHPNAKKIGTKSELIAKINVSDKDGNFTYKNGNRSEQVIYYSLGNIGWILVKEIPYDEFTNNLSRVKNIFIISFFASLLIILLLYLYWMNKITAPLQMLILSMKKVSKGEIGYTVPSIPKNEIGTLIEQFNTMSLSVKDLVEKNQIFERQKRDLEVEILQSQINPHFLYNTLNIIRWMAAVANAKNIVHCITLLGNIIRPIFKNKNVLCTLREEIEFLRSYTEIMGYRFDDDIQIDIDFNEKLLEYKVLRFILQPLIENSLIHGFKNCTGDKKIKITIFIVGEILFIEEKDNGVGISEENVIKLNNAFKRSAMEAEDLESGTGLRNVNRRIRLHFGDNYGISIQTGYNEGTRILMKLPMVM